MPRPILDEEHIHPAVRERVAGQHRALVDEVRQAVARHPVVVVAGDTGSGKELVANAIHQESKRSHHRFVAVNTGAIPRELVASELFGHVKGSFTGALKDRDGRFVEADGGNCTGQAL